MVLLATYTLVSVPIGRKTGLEHIQAIFTSKAAREAAADLKAALEEALKPRDKKKPQPARDAEEEDLGEDELDEEEAPAGNKQPARSPKKKASRRTGP